MAITQLGDQRGLLVRALHGFDHAGVRYVLMDTYELLPDAYEGQDIDILVSGRSVKAASDVLRVNGWVQTRPRSLTPWRAFVYETRHKNWIFLDFFVSERWQSEAVAEFLLENRVLGAHGFYSPCRPGLLAWKLFKDLQTERLAEDRRWARIAGILATSTEEDVEQARSLLAKMGIRFERMPALERVLQCRSMSAAAAAQIVGEGRRLGIPQAFRAAKTRRKPASLLRRPCYWLSALGQCIRKHDYYLPTIAFVGIDGSGKTSICERLVTGEFRRTSPLHVIMRRVDPSLPVYRRIRGPITRVSSAVNRFWVGRLFSPVLHWVVEFGDFVDRLARYKLGTMWAHGGFGTVLFERYPTDRLIGPSLRKGAFLFEKHFPAPDLLVYLDVSGEESVRRKSEDGASLEVQSKKRDNYLRLIDKSPYARRINGEHSKDIVCQQASEFIWQTAVKCQHGRADD